jgi:hypothetical protein
MNAMRYFFDAFSTVELPAPAGADDWVAEPLTDEPVSVGPVPLGEGVFGELAAAVPLEGAADEVDEEVVDEVVDEPPDEELLQAPAASITAAITGSAPVSRSFLVVPVDICGSFLMCGDPQLGAQGASGCCRALGERATGRSSLGGRVGYPGDEAAGWFSSVDSASDSARTSSTCSALARLRVRWPR